MRIVVTGAQGQLARSLAERIRQHEDIELIALGRPGLDLEVPGCAAAAIAKVAPDVVINAAAYTAVDQAEEEPQRAFRINADAAGEVATAAADVGAAIVHISTDYVFDGFSKGAYREDATANPLGIYGQSKLAGEQQVQLANLRHVIVRTAWVYSPFGRNFVKSIMAAAAHREEIGVVNDQHGNPTCALDLADGLVAMLRAENAWGQTYHLAGGGTATWFEFAAEIMRHCARLQLPHALVRPIGSKDWPTRADRPRNSVLDCRKFEQAFGWLLPDWRHSAAGVIERLAAGQSN